ncbi:MAG: hypothetical protein E5Y02_29600 [Mesorhizobium sp.]|uniref:hypothetical protein n=1 Tax=Mesorhizobium opportunistum TaxID=593909 RepID=UPI001202EA61|nr:MAG: hypothetical protein E5Y02_29600 [Mesorhizobium sp.]
MTRFMTLLVSAKSGKTVNLFREIVLTGYRSQHRSLGEYVPTSMGLIPPAISGNVHFFACFAQG